MPPKILKKNLAKTIDMQEISCYNITVVEKTTYIIPQKGVKHNAEGKEKPQAGTAHQANPPAYGHHEPHRGAGELDRQADRMRKGGGTPPPLG